MTFVIKRCTIKIDSGLYYTNNFGHFKNKKGGDMINIRILADEYRRQVTRTANGQKAGFETVKEHFDLYFLSKLSGSLGISFSKMKKALGSERDIRMLLRAWVRLKNIKMKYKQKNSFLVQAESRESFIRDIEAAERFFDLYHKKLPSLMERSLSRNVRQSGIRLR